MDGWIFGKSYQESVLARVGIGVVDEIFAMDMGGADIGALVGHLVQVSRDGPELFGVHAGFCTDIV